jgi:hypothetical protein
MAALATQVRTAFSRLNEQAAKSSQTSLLQCWRVVLGGRDEDVYDALGLIQAAVKRLAA